MKRSEIIRILLKNRFRNNHRRNLEVKNISQIININTNNEGYVNVRVKIDIDKFSKKKNITFISASKNDPHSICLFIAGGVEIDKKVEKANAQLAIGNI